MCLCVSHVLSLMTLMTWWIWVYSWRSSLRYPIICNGFIYAIMPYQMLENLELLLYIMRTYSKMTKIQNILEHKASCVINKQGLCFIIFDALYVVYTVKLTNHMTIKCGRLQSFALLHFSVYTSGRIFPWKIPQNFFYCLLFYRILYDQWFISCLVFFFKYIYLFLHFGFRILQQQVENLQIH